MRRAPDWLRLSAALRCAADMSILSLTLQTCLGCGHVHDLAVIVSVACLSVLEGPLPSNWENKHLDSRGMWAVSTKFPCSSSASCKCGGRGVVVKFGWGFMTTCLSSCFSGLSSPLAWNARWLPLWLPTPRVSLVGSVVRYRVEREYAWLNFSRLGHF